MPENNDIINKLLEKLENLMKRQEAFSKEVTDIREELKRLKISEKNQVTETSESISGDNKEVEVEENKVTTDFNENKYLEKEESKIQTAARVNKSEYIKTDLEKFIGENLINKIGITITIIGVAIGVKYAINHQLISPLTRILLGYLFGLGLLAVAIGLKKKYGNFSAVLLSGSMTIVYFITYAAYSFYNLLPQTFAFALMVVFTVVTVTAAINYNRQIIAHIGLVGAYAVPFLLSEGSGKVEILFSYMAIINIGILIIAFKKYWKPLYYSSFLLTWLIYLTWFGSKYRTDEYFAFALTFLSIFFVTFYLMFLAYKLIQKERFEIYDVLLLLSNAFIFYGVGYNILSRQASGEYTLGLFTLLNAIIHFLVSIIIYRQKPANRNLFYLVSGLGLIFITIAIPVQLNGNWVTLLWVGEAALLFWIGRTNKVQFYEVLSYILMVLASFSIVQDWAAFRNSIASEQHFKIITPLFNIGFLTSLIFIISFTFINFLNHNSKFPSPFKSREEVQKLISSSMLVVLLISVYHTFRVEISGYWNQLYISSLIESDITGPESTGRYWNTDLIYFKKIWIINYSILYSSVLSFLNIKKFQSRNWGYINLGLNTILLLVFLISGLYILGNLRGSYLNQTLSEYYHGGIFNILIRYISLAFAGLIIVSVKMYVNQKFLNPVPFNLKMAFDILLYTFLIWIISSEMISWMDIMHFSQTYKLGLSILWGVYALFLIVLGIRKKKKHLRIGAIVLFAIALMKLFFYDLAHLDTIPKTIILISLGILLLIISFLYIKYKNIIAEDITDQNN